MTCVEPVIHEIDATPDVSAASSSKRKGDQDSGPTKKLKIHQDLNTQHLFFTIMIVPLLVTLMLNARAISREVINKQNSEVAIVVEKGIVFYNSHYWSIFTPDETENVRVGQDWARPGMI